MIAGCVISGVVALLAIVAAVCIILFCIKRKREHKMFILSKTSRTAKRIESDAGEEGDEHDDETDGVKRAASEEQALLRKRTSTTK